MQDSPESIRKRIEQILQKLQQNITIFFRAAARGAHSAREKLAPIMKKAAYISRRFFRRVGRMTGRAVSRSGKYAAGAVRKGRSLLRRGLAGVRRFFRRVFRPSESPSGAGKKTAAVAAVLAASVLLLALGLSREPAADRGSSSGEKKWREDFSGWTGGIDRTKIPAGLRTLMTAAGESVKDIQDQVETALREEYWKLLDQGRGAVFRAGSETESRLFEEVRKERREKLREDPFLLLVNKWHTLPEDYEVEPVELDNGQRISSDCYEKLRQMLRDCAEAGGTPIVCSGFRPHWYQVNLFDAQVDRWLNIGYGREDAEAAAATAVAIPGTSEHELGLAADIYSSENMDLDESQIYTFTQQWLMENSWHYGFILRYPQDKSEITGIIFEPWHYRYVGEEHAKKIYDAGICLEEYLDEAEHP